MNCETDCIKNILDNMILIEICEGELHEDDVCRRLL